MGVPSSFPLTEGNKTFLSGLDYGGRKDLVNFLLDRLRVSCEEEGAFNSYIGNILMLELGERSGRTLHVDLSGENHEFLQKVPYGGIAKVINYLIGRVATACEGVESVGEALARITVNTVAAESIVISPLKEKS